MIPIPHQKNKPKLADNPHQTYIPYQTCIDPNPHLHPKPAQTQSLIDFIQCCCVICFSCSQEQGHAVLENLENRLLSAMLTTRAWPSKARQICSGRRIKILCMMTASKLDYLSSGPTFPWTKTRTMMPRQECQAVCSARNSRFLLEFQQTILQTKLLILAVAYLNSMQDAGFAFHIDVRDSRARYFIPVHYGLGLWPGWRVAGASAPTSASAGKI